MSMGIFVGGIIARDTPLLVPSAPGVSYGIACREIGVGGCSLSTLSTGTSSNVGQHSALNRSSGR